MGEMGEIKKKWLYWENDKKKGKKLRKNGKK